MIEPVVIHKTIIDSLCSIWILQLHSVFAVILRWPDESSWTFFRADEWRELVTHYKEKVQEQRKCLEDHRRWKEMSMEEFRRQHDKELE
jgi:hypothetical protein